MVLSINPEIRLQLEKGIIDYSVGCAYLLLKYFKVNPSVIPLTKESKEFLDNLFETTPIIIETGVIGTKKRSYKSLLSQLDIQEEKNNDLFKYDWVKNEYCTLFRNINPSRGSFIVESKRRMQKLFDSNPELTKEQVIKATKAYLETVTEPQYLKSCHYFIWEGMGTLQSSNLLDWIELGKEEQVIKPANSVDKISLDKNILQ